MNLLLIEDESDSAGWLAERLSTSGFVVHRVISSQQALCEGLSENAAAVILDVGHSGPSGRELVKPLRDAGIEQPLVLLSARGSWRDKVESLDAGADDYLIKPVRAEEVAARLRAIIRRSAGSAIDRIAVGDMDIDLKGQIARLGGKPLDLTRNEFGLLSLFLMRAGRVLANQEIRSLLYSGATSRSVNAVEVHIARLRSKIGRERIRTIRGLGYRLALPAAAQNTAHGSNQAETWNPVI